MFMGLEESIRKCSNLWCVHLFTISVHFSDDNDGWRLIGEGAFQQAFAAFADRFSNSYQNDSFTATTSVVGLSLWHSRKGKIDKEKFLI